MKVETLGDRMKQYEARYESYVPYDNYIVVRIDGAGFSKYTKGFNKPFDCELSNAFIEATKVLVSKYGAVSGYTQSDEITIIIPPYYRVERKLVTKEYLLENHKNKDFYMVEKANNEKEYKLDYTYINNYLQFGINEDIELFSYKDGSWSDEIVHYFNRFDFYEELIINNQIYSGRVQKLVSRMASTATLVFNRYLGEQLSEELSYKKDKAEFDTRLFGIKEPEEVLNTILFRSRDCIRNSKAMFCQAYCSHKSLLNKNTGEMISYCKKETNQDWNELEPKFKYGILVKKEVYKKTTNNITVERGRLITLYKNLSTFSEPNLKLILSKYYEV